MSKLVVALFGAAIALSALAREPGFEEYRAVQQSLSRVHPRLRNRWLNVRGLGLPGYNAPLSVSDLDTDSGISLAGKWGRGPSVEVTGRDSLVFLSLGSEVAIISCARPDSPQVVAEVQAMGLATQAAVRDSFLYIGCKAGQAGIEVWSIENPAQPVFRSRTPTLLSDFCIRDTFLYLTQSLSGPNDTFKVFSIADPENVYLLGSCRDSGDAIAVTNNAAFLADRWGLYSIDVADPMNPHQIGSYPGMPISLEARGTICCATFGNPNQPEWLRFTVLDVTNPASPAALGSIDNCGGYDMHLEDSLAFLSGYYTGGHEFVVVNIRDTARPVRLGSCTTPGYNFGVWADLTRRMAFVADGSEGLASVGISNLNAPMYEEARLVAGVAQDVYVDGVFCYVASLDAGMRILDVSMPSQPVEIGALDTVSSGLATFSAVARDSFAYVCWWPQPYLRVASVADPADPQLVAGDSVFAFPEDMVIRDSLLYIAQEYRLQVVNVARPRAPVMVGTCTTLYGAEWGLVLQDTVGYCGSWAGLTIVNVARPSAPFVVSTTGGTRMTTCGVAVHDTFCYVPSGYETLWVVSVARPAEPRAIAGAPLGSGNRGRDAAMYNDTMVVVGGSRKVMLFDVSDGSRPRATGTFSTPYWVRRVVFSPPYLYACCEDAGVMILETTGVGLQEPRQAGVPPPPMRFMPNPANEFVCVRLSEPLLGGGQLSLFDASGRRVMQTAIAGQARETRLCLTGLSSGLYFIQVKTKTGVLIGRLIKR